ncbi:MAG: flagellar hook-basal body complex protein FliE [Thermoplasmata archaeon]|nr:flagellar hook-basal body complex protein FliE [Thermoplasmata archaeon]
MPGSGKEEFIKVATDLGFQVVRMGDLVREEVRSRGGDLDDASVGGLANSEREKYGMGIWALRTLPKISGSKVLIDGIRGIAEIEVYREAYPESLFVVSLESSDKVRYERIKERGRKDATPSEEQFKERDNRERSWGLQEAMAVADYRIANEGSLQEYKEEVARVLREIIDK